MITWPLACRAVALCAALAGAFCTRPAEAAPNDAEAQRLDQEAMDGHFAAAEFKPARKSLERALKRCKSGCSAKLRARLHRDLAVVLITGFSDADAGARELERALAADADLKLQPEYSSAEVRAVFARVRARSKAPAAKSDQAALRHEPVTQQRSNTPIPIYAELETGDEESKLRVHYRAGERGPWHSVRMRPLGDGFAAEIPCEASKTPGKVAYYIRVKDDEGTTVAEAGSREQPYDVEISSEKPEDPPHLPGQRAPRRCTAAAESAASDCETGDEPACAPAPPRSPAGPPKVWLSLGLAQDVALIAGKDVCSRQGQLERGFACFRESGTQYHGTPERGTAGTIDPGLVLSTTRVYLASEVRIFRAFDLGLRTGFAIAGRGLTPDGGKGYFPMHGELRGQYWLSDTAFPPSLAAFVFVAGGVAQVDASQPVRVIEDRSVPPPPGQLDNPDTQTLDAYKKSGMSFAALGVGAFLPFGAGHGLLGDLKAMALFPDTGAALEVELGYALGL